ncbi:hypothetical protein VCUG_00478 [Vavraia culicis subsp. floridensis]|uniref:Uncharacterized protein n=1 Tax=Vavraia culicis (isolate floridensis) TaxID=948595 RepID=L2GY87_VAVCU|nr:uncharacterized protein VCUG_00478 [Vavraia culicis subsp. floridensis]ELA48055.1 hypothetical protein VCUG_00478 [Vavraia culicis subsp. floridensis]
MHLIGYLFVFGCVRANTFVNDLQRRLYYESMIDLDTVIFLMEVNQMNESECKELVKDVVLPMRNFLVNIFSRKRGGSRLIDKKTRDRGWTDDEDESDETRGKTELDTKDIQTIKNNFKNNEKNKKGKKNDDGMDLGETLMDILRATSNFSLNVKTKYGKIDKSLEKRNKLFEFDRSQIAKSLFNTSHQKLLKDVETFLRESSASGTNPKKDGIRTFLSIKDANKKDTKYFQMIETIEKAVTETENIVKIKQREENEFTLVFGQQMKQEEVRVLKMSFNLGSTFLTPSIYLSTSKALMIPEKSVFIEKMTNAMLKPILTLTNTNSIGADTEKKESILNFLRDVVSRASSKYTDEIDGAFKARSTILDKFLRDDKDEVKERKMMQIDTVLEKRNKELLGKVESMRAEHFKDFLVLNQEIINVYIRFLNSNSASDRSKVNEYFK